MRKVRRDEVVDYVTYEETRSAFRKEAMQAKAARRVLVGDCLTFLFENPVTVRYQVQEMMRTEKLVRERDIAHELETYNGLLGGDGELGCSLLVEIEDPAVRDVKLKEWFDLPEHLYALLEDGTRVRPFFDESQRGRDRLSSVQYLRFPVRGRVPLAIGADHPTMTAQAALSAEQRRALAEDLQG